MKFCIVGVSNTAISLAVYYLFVFIDPGFYQLGNVFGWIVGVLNSFFWNNRYVFHSETKDGGAVLKKIGKTYLAYGATWAMSALLLYFEVEVFGLSEKISPLINLLATVPLNYLLNKFWTFREKAAERQRWGKKRKPSLNASVFPQKR